MTAKRKTVKKTRPRNASKDYAGAKRKRRPRGYSDGQLNYLIDDLLHPLYKENEGFRLVDAVLHGVVEQDLSQSVKKFIRYNLPAVMKKVRKQLK